MLGNSQAKIALIPSLLMFPAAFSLFKGAHSKRLMLPTEHCIYNGSFSIPRACFLFTKQRWVRGSLCCAILASPVLESCGRYWVEVSCFQSTMNSSSNFGNPFVGLGGDQEANTV